MPGMGDRRDCFSSHHTRIHGHPVKLMDNRFRPDNLTGKENKLWLSMPVAMEMATSIDGIKGE